MRRAIPVLLLTAAFGAAPACTPTDDARSDGGVPGCEAAHHCRLVAGEPTCEDGYTWANPDEPADLTCVAEGTCTPTTCAEAGAECGSLDDGCGGTLTCGTCTGGETCGGGGTPNACGRSAAENDDTLCANGLDDDGDGFTDCDDYDCSRSADVTVCAKEDTDTQCANGLDDDGDGFTDCDDYDCSRSADVTVCAKEDTDALCANGLDDDGDGFTDCDDYDCADLPACTCQPTTCAAEGAACGSLDDGCGGTLACGTCPTGSTCGADHACTAVTPPLTEGGPLGDLSGLPAGASWPMPGRSPTRQYRADGAGPAAVPSEAWSVRLTEYGAFDDLVSEPIVDGEGTTYVAVAHTLYAVSASGTLNFTWRASGHVTADPVLDATGVIYVPVAGQFSESTLVALWPDGSERWRLDTGTSLALGSPVVAGDGTIYVGYGDTLWAVSPEGSEVWKAPGTGGGGVTLHPGGNILVAGAGHVTAVDAEGVVQWTRELPPSYEVPHAPAVLADGSLLVTNTQTVARLTAGGEVIWSMDAPGYLSVPPAVGPEGHVYLLHTGLNQSLHAIDSNGAELWTAALPYASAEAQAPPVVDADGNVYVWFGAPPSVFANDVPLVSLGSDGAERWIGAWYDGSRTPPLFTGAGIVGTVVTSGTSGVCYALTLFQ